MSGGALSAGTVSLGVKGDAKGFGAKVAADVKGQGSIFSDLGKHVGGLIVGGLGLAGIGLSIGAVFKTGFDEASDASAGIAQLTAGIKSTGNAAGVSVKGMTDLASSIQDMSGQTDDSIVKAEQLLLTFTNIKNVGPNKIFDQATQAAADMAAKMGGDASQQAIQLGKALNDPVKGVTALQRVGVSFTQAQKDQIAAMVKSGDTMGAQKIILKELQTEFGGAAKAAGETLPGELARGKRAFEDMSQSVVETLLPIVQPAIAGVADALKKASPFIVEFASAIGEKISAGVQIAKPFIDDLIDGAKRVGGWITGTAVPAIESLVQGFQDGTGPGGAIRDVVNGVWSVVKMLGDALVSLDLPGKFRALVQQWQDGSGIGGALRDVTQRLFDALSGFGNFLSNTLVPDIKDVVKWMGDHKKLVEGFVVIIGGAILAFQAYTATMAIVRAATAAWAAIQEILDAAMNANPIGLIVIAIGALVAGIVWVATQTTFFQDVWHSVWGGVTKAFNNTVQWIKDAAGDVWNFLKTVFGWTPLGMVVEHFGAIVDFFKGIPGRIGDALKDVGSFIAAPFKMAFNGVAGLWNKTVGGMHFDIPSWVPGIGGKGFTMPQIPTLAQGATVMPTPGGTVVRVAEAGRAESIVDTGKLNNLLDKATNGVSVTNNIYEAVSAEATANQVTRRLVARFV